jgi:alcohol dehydrogenase, propanol-preferring
VAKGGESQSGMSDGMQAMVLTEPGKLELRTVEAPVSGEGEIVIEVSACGVCRTDLQIFAGDIPARKTPLIPGHQIVGRILGSGERVGLAWLWGACGHCKHCLAGLENLCELAQFTGWTVDGGYAQLVVAREDYVYPLPEGVGDIDAAPLLCAGIIGYRALRLSGITPGGILGLFGFGSSAHLAIQVARHWGCEVAVFCHLDQERELAARLGATWVGGYDAAPPTPLDAAVTFAPVGSVVVSALRATGPGGTVAINAIHLDRVPEFSYDLLWRERSLRSVANFTREDARAFLELAVEIPIRPETTLFDLTDAEAALRMLDAGEIRGSAVLRIPQR